MSPPCCTTFTHNSFCCCCHDAPPQCKAQPSRTKQRWRKGVKEALRCELWRIYNPRKLCIWIQNKSSVSGTKQKAPGVKAPLVRVEDNRRAPTPTAEKIKSEKEPSAKRKQWHFWNHSKVETLIKDSVIVPFLDRCWMWLESLKPTRFPF